MVENFRQEKGSRKKSPTIWAINKRLRDLASVGHWMEVAEEN